MNLHNPMGKPLMRYPLRPLMRGMSANYNSGTPTGVTLPLPDGVTAGYSYDINTAGIVVGEAETVGGLQPIKWAADGTPTLLSLPVGGTVGTAFSINTAGVMVGEVIISGVKQPVKWATDGSPTVLGLPATATSGALFGINDAGVMVGRATISGVFQPCEWGVDGTPTVFSLPAGATAGYMNILNSSNTRVGEVTVAGLSQPCRWGATGTPNILNMPAGAIGGSSYDVNYFGVMAGWVTISGANQPCKWSASGDPTLLDLPVDGTAGFAYSINDAGAIAGSVYFVDPIQHAYIWQPDGTLTDLGLRGLEESYANSINNDGTTVSDAALADYTIVKPFKEAWPSGATPLWDERTALWPNSTDPGIWVDPSILTATYLEASASIPVSPVGTVTDANNPAGFHFDIRSSQKLGQENTVNGTFTTDISGWAVGSAATAVRDTTIFANGGIKVRGGGASGADAGVSQVLSGLTVGKTYRVCVDAYAPSPNSVSRGATISILSGPVIGPNSAQVSAEDVIQRIGFSFTATATTQTIYLYVVNRNVSWGLVTDFAYFDNVSVKEVPVPYLSQDVTGLPRPLTSSRTNMLLKSELFKDAVWVPQGLAAASTDNNLIVSTSNVAHMVVQTVSSIIGKSITARIWLKANGYNTVYIQLGQNTGDPTAAFNLGTGVILSDNCPIPATMTLQPDGYYCCEVHGVAATTSTLLYCYIANTDNVTLVYPGNGTGGVLIQKAHLEYGTVSTPYQRVNTTSDYDGYSSYVFDLFDGADDELKSHTHPAGIIGNSNMDCLVAIRRNTAAATIVGLYEVAGGLYMGVAESGSSLDAFSTALGTPTVWVDNVQVPGGTAVTRGSLHTALTVDVWHILEFRGLNMSAWTSLGYGSWNSGYRVNGRLGGIMLFPSASAADRDKARTRLAAKVGLVL